MNSFIIQDNDSRQKSARETAIEQAKYLTTDNNPVQKNQDILLYAFFQILESVNIQSNVAATQTKVLESNAFAQQNLNDQQNELNFKTVAKNGDLDETHLESVQMDNQQVQKERNYLSNKLLLAQQNAQVTETQVSTTTNNTQQAAQIDSGISQMLSQITNQISRV
jgi:hypothetical protein